MWGSGCRLTSGSGGRLSGATGAALGPGRGEAFEEATDSESEVGDRDGWSGTTGDPAPSTQAVSDTVNNGLGLLPGRWLRLCLVGLSRLYRRAGRDPGPGPGS